MYLTVYSGVCWAVYCAVYPSMCWAVYSAVCWAVQWAVYRVAYSFTVLGWWFYWYQWEGHVKSVPDVLMCSKCVVVCHWHILWSWDSVVRQSLTKPCIVDWHKLGALTFKMSAVSKSQYTVVNAMNNFGWIQYEVSFVTMCCNHSFVLNTWMSWKKCDECNMRCHLWRLLNKLQPEWYQLLLDRNLLYVWILYVWVIKNINLVFIKKSTPYDNWIYIYIPYTYIM